VPNDVFTVRALKPISVCVVPAKVRIDRVRHGADITLTGHVPREDHQTRHVEAAGDMVAIATEMLRLLITGGHRTYGRAAGLRKRCG